MNLYTRAILSLVEEDNESRSFFRIFPLLNDQGHIVEEAVRLWPDEGGLRIVPDKLDLFHFKDRMRSMGGFCLLDMRSFPSGSSKIRTNKNYGSESHEVNQYIVYSDAICPLPEDFCLEVIPINHLSDPLPYPPMIFRYLLRCGDSYYDADKRPVDAPHDVYPLWCRAYGQREVSLCHRIHEEDGAPCQTRETAGEPLSTERVPHDNAPIPIGYETAVHENSPGLPCSVFQAKQHSVRIQDEPLYPYTRRPRDTVAETVDALIRTGKRDAQLSDNGQDAELSYIENPIEHTCDHIRALWQNTDTHSRIIQLLLSLPGFKRQWMRAAAAAEGNERIYRIASQELTRLEGDRLTLLMQIDQAKSDLKACEDQVFAQMSRSKKEQLHRLEQANETASAETRRLSAAIEAQENKLTALGSSLQTMDLIQGSASSADPPLYRDTLVLVYRHGVRADIEALTSRARKVLAHMGLELEYDEIINLLILFALCPVIQITNADLGVGQRYAAILTDRMGLAGSSLFIQSAEQQVLVGAALADAAPAIIVTPFLRPQQYPDAVRTLLLAKAPCQYTATYLYETCPWPILSFPAADPAEHLAAETDPLPPVSFSAYEALLEGEDTLLPEASRFMQDLQSALSGYPGVIPASVWPIILRYVRAASGRMRGGFTVAADYACAQWILPGAVRDPRILNALQPLLTPLPICSSIFGPDNT